MNIYDFIREKSCEDGKGFMVTPDRAIIEVEIYCGAIINAKSIRLSREEICSALSAAEVKDFSIRSCEVDPGTAQPWVVLCTFPSAPSTVDKSRTTPSGLVRLVRILPGLMRSDKEQGAKAFDFLHRHISAVYPSFLPNIDLIRKRIDRVSEAFGIQARAPENKPLPADIYSVPQWIFSSFDCIGDRSIKDLLLYFVFFGDLFRKLLRTNVEKETSLGAKQGFAILSKTVYPGLQESRSADIFRSMEKIGAIKIDWHTNQKKAMAFTKADFDRLGLHSDDKITLIFGD